MDIGRKTLEPRKRIPLPSLDGIGIETLEQPQITPVPSRAEWDLQQNVVNNAPIPQRQAVQGQQGLGQQLPPLEDENYATPPTELSVQQDRYSNAVRSRPNKQGNLAQAAWWALQGINKIFNPQDDTPVQWLGEAKREKRIATEAAKLAPLQAQEQWKGQQAKQQAELGYLQMRPELAVREAERKLQKDTQTAKYNELRIKLGETKANNWMWAQEQLAKHRDGTLKVSQERLKQYQQMIDETERNNNLNDENKDADRKLKGDIAGQNTEQKVLDRKQKAKEWAAKQKLTRVALQKDIDARIAAGTMTPEAGQQMIADIFDQ